MKLRRFMWLFIGLLLISSALSPQVALAQGISEPTGLKNVTVWVNPEYDDPRLLFMVEGEITGTALPAFFRFLVPNTAEMYSAGSKDAQGKYSGGPPSRKASSITGWDEISYTLPTTASTFRVEYYNDIITGISDKKISYDFYWLYSISNLQIVIQQPLKATNFVVTPTGIKTVEDGFNVVTFTRSNLGTEQSAQPLHFDISYTKTDPNPSLQGADPPASTGGSTSNTIALIVIGVALVAVAVFLVLFLLKRSPGRPAKLAPRFEATRPVKSKHGQNRDKAARGDKFCDQCGQPVSRSARFCAGCGNKLG